jgi:hypothetical protein
MQTAASQATLLRAILRLFTEIESGKLHSNWPELARALEPRSEKPTLVIASSTA